MKIMAQKMDKNWWIQQKKKKKRTLTGVSEEELVNRAVKEGPQIPGLHNWIIVGAIG